VFARYLNLTVGYVSQLERGAKRPTGPALVLLNVIRRKGSRRYWNKRAGAAWFQGNYAHTQAHAGFGARAERASRNFMRATRIGRTAVR
jgi:hypothetical protein